MGKCCESRFSRCAFQASQEHPPPLQIKSQIQNMMGGRIDICRPQRGEFCNRRPNREMRTVQCKWQVFCKTVPALTLLECSFHVAHGSKQPPPPIQLRLTLSLFQHEGLSAPDLEEPRASEQEDSTLDLEYAILESQTSVNSVWTGINKWQHPIANRARSMSSRQSSLTLLLVQRRNPRRCSSTSRNRQHAANTIANTPTR